MFPLPSLNRSAAGQKVEMHRLLLRQDIYLMLRQWVREGVLFEKRIPLHGLANDAGEGGTVSIFCENPEPLEEVHMRRAPLIAEQIGKDEETLKFFAQPHTILEFSTHLGRKPTGPASRNEIERLLLRGHLMLAGKRRPPKMGRPAQLYCSDKAAATKSILAWVQSEHRYRQAKVEAEYERERLITAKR